MKRPAPLVWLYMRKMRECRELHDDVTAHFLRILSLESRLAVAMRERDQAIRDAELIALMAKDKQAALAFLRDRHRIEGLEETA